MIFLVTSYAIHGALMTSHVWQYIAILYTKLTAIKRPFSPCKNCDCTANIRDATDTEGKEFCAEWNTVPSVLSSIILFISERIRPLNRWCQRYAIKCIILLSSTSFIWCVIYDHMQLVSTNMWLFTWNMITCHALYMDPPYTPVKLYLVVHLSTSESHVHIYKFISK